MHNTSRNILLLSTALLCMSGAAFDARAAAAAGDCAVKSPNSGYALYALKEISAKLGDTLAADAYNTLFAKAWAGTKPPDLNRL
jgi:hypothetical protein